MAAACSVHRSGQVAFPPFGEGLYCVKSSVLLPDRLDLKTGEACFDAFDVEKNGAVACANEWNHSFSHPLIDDASRWEPQRLSQLPFIEELHVEGSGPVDLKSISIGTPSNWPFVSDQE